MTDDYRHQLKALRDKYGLTQEQVGDHMDYTTQHIYQLESGRCRINARVKRLICQLEDKLEKSIKLSS